MKRECAARAEADGRRSARREDDGRRVSDEQCVASSAGCREEEREEWQTEEGRASAQLMAGVHAGLSRVEGAAVLQWQASDSAIIHVASAVLAWAAVSVASVPQTTAVEQVVDRRGHVPLRYSNSVYRMSSCGHVALSSVLTTALAARRGRRAFLHLLNGKRHLLNSPGSDARTVVSCRDMVLSALLASFGIHSTQPPALTRSRRVCCGHAARCMQG